MDRVDKSKIPEEEAAEMVRKLLFPNKYVINKHELFLGNDSTISVENKTESVNEQIN